MFITRDIVSQSIRGHLWQLATCNAFFTTHNLKLNLEHCEVQGNVLQGSALTQFDVVCSRRKPCLFPSNHWSAERRFHATRGYFTQKTQTLQWQLQGAGDSFYSNWRNTTITRCWLGGSWIMNCIAMLIWSHFSGSCTNKVSLTIVIFKKCASETRPERQEYNDTESCNKGKQRNRELEIKCSHVAIMTSLHSPDADRLRDGDRDSVKVHTAGYIRLSERHKMCFSIH